MGRRLPRLCRIECLPQRPPARTWRRPSPRLRRRGRLSDATTATSAAASGTDVPVPKDGAVRSAPPRVVIGTGGFRQDASAPTTKSPHAERDGRNIANGRRRGSPSSPQNRKGPTEALPSPPRRGLRHRYPPSRTANTCDAARTPRRPSDDRCRLSARRRSSPVLRSSRVAARRCGRRRFRHRRSSRRASQTSSTPMVGLVSRVVSGVVNAILSRSPL